MKNRQRCTEKVGGEDGGGVWPGGESGGGERWLWGRGGTRSCEEPDSWKPKINLDGESICSEGRVNRGESNDRGQRTEHPMG